MERAPPGTPYDSVKHRKSRSHEVSPKAKCPCCDQRHHYNGENQKWATWGNSAASDEHGRGMQPAKSLLPAR